MIGIIAAILTTISFLPQVTQIIKTKDTSGISLGMYSLYVIGSALWAVHGLISKDMSVLFANIVTFTLSLIILGFKITNERNKNNFIFK